MIVQITQKFKNMKRYIYLMILGFILLISCQKEKIGNDLTIVGSIMQLEVEFPEIMTPLAGQKVFLLNLEFTIDTTTGGYRESDVLDSAFTNTDGKYQFLQVPSGDYVVLPVDSSHQYNFDWSQSPDSIWILAESDQTEFEINFTTPIPTSENGVNFHFKFMNFGYGEAPFENPSIELFRTCRSWEYKGWGTWGPNFGWSDWYWSSVDRGSRNWNLGEFAKLPLTDPKDASGAFYQYKDEFHIKFYQDGMKWMKTLSLPGGERSEGELLEYNEFQVIWGLGDDGIQIRRNQ